MSILSKIRTKENKSKSIFNKYDKKSVLGIVGFVLLALYSITIVGVLVWGAMSALKTNIDFKTNMFGLPKHWMFSNFSAAFKELFVEIETSDGGQRSVFLVEMIFWSLCTSVIPAVICTLTTAICMYTLAKYRFRGRKLIYNILLIVMLLPIVGALPAQLQMQKSLGVYDNIFWLWGTSGTIWSMGQATGGWLVLYAIYKSLSWEFAEAAFIDGAGHHQVFWRIMLPLSKSSVGVMILLHFIAAWNDYQLSLVYLPSYPTLAYGLYDFQFSRSQVASSITIQLAATTISFVPILVIFLILKDKMMGSLTVGGLKG